MVAPTFKANNPQLYENIYEHKSTFRSSEKSANSVRISPDGKTLATCSSDGLIRVYSADIKAPKLLVTLSGHEKGVSCIEYSPINPNILVSGSDDLTIRLWSILQQKCIKVLSKHTYHITTVKFNTKGNLLVSGSSDENITIWDISNGKPIKTLAAHSDPILSVALTPDDSIIVSASYDGLMRLFDTASGQCLKTLTVNSSTHGTATALTNDVVNFPISNVECSPNGKYILSSSLDGTLRLWNYMENKVVKTFTLADGDNVVPVCEKFSCGARFITKGRLPLIVSGSDKSGVILWDIQTKGIVTVLCEKAGLIEGDSPVLDIDTYDGGRLLVCCSRDGTIRLYQMREDYYREN